MNGTCAPFRFFLPLLAFAVLVRTAEGQAFPATLGGFAEIAEGGLPPPASICFTRSEEGCDGWAALEAARRMLGELEKPLSEPPDRFPASVGDLLAFRDWCTGAPGGGNLALAISAEEVAVELLFRALAGGNPAWEEIREAFRRCSRNGMTADCWLDALSLEGVKVECGTATDGHAAEYRRLEAIFTFINKNCAGSWAGSFFPKTDWPREGGLATFNPYALVWRSMMLERKKVALETCLAIQDAMGGIPEEREEFRRAAEKCADAILRNRERVTSWMTAYDAWKFWAEAVKAAPGK